VSLQRLLNWLYTRTFNRKHHRVSHVFQGRYKAVLVEKDAQLLELHRSIVLNPSQSAWSTGLNNVAGTVMPHPSRLHAERNCKLPCLTLCDGEQGCREVDRKRLI